MHCRRRDAGTLDGSGKVKKRECLRLFAGMSTNFSVVWICTYLYSLTRKHIKRFYSQSVFKEFLIFSIKSKTYYKEAGKVNYFHVISLLFISCTG